ncbi:hypothetical protein [Streptomyces chilikensis]|uniref:hypothetical protein n=1 Tax=Streptomyces chilikensis TaxID=1194079 RepID=UPI000B0DFCA5|nr:hypothetical protein [Streptomyces chilikensis]
MVVESVLRGYLLEEVIAWLLRSSGYRLLSERDEQEKHPAHRVLQQRQHGLTVRGRGARHQADALGQFSYVPPFSLPVRLFVEAKFTGTKVGLPTVRNGLGVLRDVNENMVTSLNKGSSGRPRQRYHYSYAIFSTAGFSRDAQEFALAHQMSLIDLSMPDFAPLRDLVRTQTRRLFEAIKALPNGKPPRLYTIRSHLRRQLALFGDADDGLFRYPNADTQLPEEIARPLDHIAGHLVSSRVPDLVLAFPSAPFVLGLASENLSSFIAYARRHPTHTVNVGRLLTVPAPHPIWAVRPADGSQAYAMTFTMPEQVESWILEQEDSVHDRARWIKRTVLSTMTIYWVDGDHTHTFQLRYAPVALRG